MDTQTSPSPIYDQLVREHGDVPAQARAAAEHLRRQGERHLNPRSQPVGPGDDWFN